MKKKLFIILILILLAPIGSNLFYCVGLDEQPQFAEMCVWKKLNGDNWAELLSNQPQFTEMLDKLKKNKRTPKQRSLNEKQRKL